MRSAGWVAALSLLICTFAAAPARADDDPGQESLDKAIEAKLNAGEGVLGLGEVIKHCQKALKDGLTGQNDRLAKQLLATALFERGSKFADAVLSASPESAEELRQLARIRGTAVTDLEQAIELEPKSAASHLYLGRLLALGGDDEKRAEETLTQAIDLAGGDAETKAKALLARAELPRSAEKRLADYNDAVKLSPRDPDARRARALFHFNQGKSDEGLADVDAAIKINPKDAKSHMLRGLALAAARKFEDSLASLTKAVELEPQSPLPYEQRARVYLLQSKGKEALDDVNKALSVGQPTAALLLLRAGAHQALGDDEKALEDIDTILKFQPGLPQAVRARAALLAGTGKITEAITDLESLLKGGQNDTAVMLQIGMLYLADKKADKAIETFSGVLKREPKNPAALTARADAYLQAGKHAEAVADYTAAHELFDKSDHVLNNLAWVLCTSPDDKVRDGKRAIELAKKACELTEYKEAHILSTLAAAYAETGDFETAVDWSTKAVEASKVDEAATGDIAEQLKKELQSYKDKKPWREKLSPEEKKQEEQKEDEKKPEEKKPAEKNAEDKAGEKQEK